MSIIKEVTNNQMPSFTEWFDKIGYQDTEKFRLEDNTKRDRLEILYQIAGLPYDRPERLTVRDIVDNTPAFQDVVRRKGDQLCALRLVPTKPELPKLRQRGLTLNEYLAGWFRELKINPDDYKVEVVPHNDQTLYSLIFVITKNDIFGEAYAGPLWDLSTGLHEKNSIPFIFSSGVLKIENIDEAMRQIIAKAVNLLQMDDSGRREILHQQINAEFDSANRLIGYFESVVWPNQEIFLVDYNRLIPDLFSELNFNQTKDGDLSGLCASPGQAVGKIKIITNPNNQDIEQNEILVCPMTTINYLPLMRKAAGIITEQGNILSHAAIISRELKKPCLVGVKNAMKLLKDGQEVELDANNGIVKIVGN
ncbi:MAG: hypothetical protein A3G00_03010 [Candidatus Magasanikbacteria bacterium RIFCSPLOWO2_12_FULL_43_12]|uniref:PEP-utilising enzyme mobile domain-containing protein n=1 Tax=Candidatus Magasanikbacteria bacterium RIFCSPLOWO2_12_FULL_43_12 TaxID=1798692 RepID=A0A1F6MRH9_9BACT|nr:MAG: hypothetical protein A3G00_03010 [Candidatus Magasanikbacteria bacterium RIFCSPLOWO2_12_FULL_43_12]